MNRKADLAAGLFFFLLSAGYFFSAEDIPLFFGDEFAPFNAQTLPRLLGLLGMGTSGLMILFSTASLVKNSSPAVDVEPKKHNWAQVGYMSALMIAFGVLLGLTGFFTATVLFLATGLLLLGERRPLIIVFVPLVAATSFAVLLHGLLNIYMDDPVLRLLGVI